MLKIFFLIFVCFFAFQNVSLSYTNHNSLLYQNSWCTQNGGITGMTDYSAPDCWTKDLAVSFNYAKMVYDNLSKTFYLAALSGKKPAVVYIIENFETDKRYSPTLNNLAKNFNFRYWIVTKNELANYFGKIY